MLLNFHTIFLKQDLVVGSIAFGLIYLIIDLHNEEYTAAETKSLTYLGMVCLIVYGFSIKFISVINVYNLENNEISRIFGNQIRTIAADIFVSYGVMQLLNIVIFDRLKKATEGKFLWIRTSFSTFCSQTLTAICFYEIAFIGIYSQNQIISMIFSGLLIKYGLIILEIPTLYCVKLLKRFDIKHEEKV